MNEYLKAERYSGVGMIILTAAWLAGCQTQNVTSRPENVVIWEDPETGVQGQTIRDVNNDDDRFVVIGSNGRVQFSFGSVCNDCDTDLDNARIQVDGAFVDIRFGVAPVGDEIRRSFLVDAQNGTFIELVGGGDEPVTFRATDEVFEDPDDDSDDRAISAGTTSNPSNEAQQESGLCGALGGLGLGLLLLAPLVGWRRP